MPLFSAWLQHPRPFTFLQLRLIHNIVACLNALPQHNLADKQAQFCSLTAATAARGASRSGPATQSPDEAVAALAQLSQQGQLPGKFFGRLCNVAEVTEGAALPAVNAALQEVVNLAANVVVSDRCAHRGEQAVLGRGSYGGGGGQGLMAAGRRLPLWWSTLGALQGHLHSHIRVPLNLLAGRRQLQWWPTSRNIASALSPAVSCRSCPLPGPPP